MPAAAAAVRRDFRPVVVAAAGAAVAAVVDEHRRTGRTAQMKRTLLLSAALAAVLAASAAYAEPEIAKYIGEAPESFADEQAAIDKFKTSLAAKDIPALSALLGLNPDQVGTSDGFAERFADLQQAAAQRFGIEEDGDYRRVIVLGDLIWPFPFPLVKTDGNWHFDTTAGLEEILDRRIGENELEAMDSARKYLDAQAIYRSQDWDNDGVFEYAQTLKSDPGEKNGLYWPAEDGAESPLGPFIVEDKATGASKSPDGYYGYRYRVLTKQGDNIAGGAYDYVINGNMIGGFGLIASPARYGETGIKTFVINHNGTLYEKDLGDSTETEAAKITEFNPDQSWTLVPD
jgi:hypothetical protein